MKKIFVSVLAIIVAFMMLPAGVYAANIAGHELRFAPEDISYEYSAPELGSIDLPENGFLLYPYADGRFSLTVDVPRTVYTGEPFSINTSIKSLMSGPDDPDWGYWIHYQQLYIPAGVSGPTAWREQLNCFARPGEPEIRTGSVKPVSLADMMNPRWYDQGVVSYQHNGSTVVVGTNMVSHRMGPWLFLQDSDEVVWGFSPFTVDEPGDYTFELYFNNSIYEDSLRYDWRVKYEPVRFVVRAVDKPVVAELDVDPNTLNTKSKGNWISATIEAAPCDMSLVDLNTLTLNGVSAVPGFFELGDRDFDGVPDLTVKFSRSAIIGSIAGRGAVTLTITGSAGGITFAGSDVIKVI